MKGQWFGTYEGSNKGKIVVELDERDTFFAGIAYLFDENPNLPSIGGIIVTNDKSPVQKINVTPVPLQRLTGNFSNWREEAQYYPGTRFPTEADVSISFSSHELNIDWKTDIETFGKAELKRTDSSRPSDLQAVQVSSWKQFKEFASDFPPDQLVFRGQEKSASWRLRTHFHRNGRYDLNKFRNTDIPQLYRATIQVSEHKFNMLDPDEVGSFYSLVQHHGYPTPLLDWSYSPYVAAFFAYSTLPKQHPHTDETVRIFVFDAKAWIDRFQQVVRLGGVLPHFSVLHPLGYGNARIVAQQGMSTLTNVDDIEEYIKGKEVEAGRLFLSAVDLPVSARNQVMGDLALMGITAASLFPGVDGVCKYLREKLF